MGATCIFEGNDVQCFVSCSENGSITSNLLAVMLKRMYDLTLFPRGDSLPDPFLLHEGHGRRFDFPFLEYINNDQYKWITCIGKPYGTNKWQVGDSSQQNGSFKM
jgi:hypothetical protein